MNFGEGHGPDRGVLAGLAVPRRVLLADEPRRLVLKPVQRSGEHRALLVPDDLLVVDEADAQEAGEDFGREPGCVPDVGHLQAGHELERPAPVGSRVSADARFVMARGAVPHVARFGGRGVVFLRVLLRHRGSLRARHAAVESGAVAPFGIELDTVRRISDHQQRLCVRPGAAIPLPGWWRRAHRMRC